MKNRHMIFAGCDTVALAEKYGTPLYVMSEDYIIERCDEIRKTFTEKYSNTRAVFACKAFQTMEIIRIMEREGLGMDAVSGGELYAELKGGLNPANIVFHGNTKTTEELEMALRGNVGTIVVDNESELLLLNELAEKEEKKPRVLYRITPGVDSHTHKYISTGQKDSKFGISLKQAQEDGYVKRAIEMQHIEFYGFHFHIGSQLLDNTSHLMAVDIMLQLMKDIRDELGYTVKELNVGGGFGIQYAGDEERKPLCYFMDPIMEKVLDFCNKENFPQPLITIEPGRWIVGEAGITIYQVGSVKTNGVGRTYVGVDGGFPDNPRPALYEAKYEAEAIGKMDQEKDQTVTIAGKCCESGDILISDVSLPLVERGDYLALLCTGAYNYSMASNYNRVPRPAVVMVRQGEDRLSVRRETYEDLIEREL